MEIILKNIFKEFADNDSSSRKTVIDNFSYSFSSGNFYIIRGASGSGKSTLLSIIGLLDKPTSGSVAFSNSSEFSTEKSALDFKFLANHISYMFQCSSLNMELTCRENLNFFSKIPENDVLSIAADLGITSILDQKTLLVSKGEKQRISVARAILENKDVAIFDEPTANLDDLNTNLVFKAIEKYCANKVVLIATHEKCENVPFDYHLLEFAESKIVDTFKKENYKPSQPTIFQPRKRNISKKYFLSEVKFTLLKSKTRFILALLLQMIIIPFVALILNLTMVNANSLIVQKLVDSELRLVNVDSNPDKLVVYRTFDATFDASSSKHKIAFSENDTFNFASKNFTVIDNQIVIPQILADNYSLAKDQEVYINGVLAIIQDIYDDKFESYSESLSLFIADDKTLENAIYNSTPVFVSQSLAQQLVKIDSISISSDTMVSLNHQVREITEERFQLANLRYIPSVSTNLKRDEITILFNDFIQAQFEDALSVLIGENLEVSTPEKDNIFNFSAYIDTLAVKSINFLPSMEVLDYSVVISEILYKEILADNFNNGLGTDAYLALPDNQFCSNNFMQSGLNSFGIITSGDYNSLNFYTTISIIVPFALVFLLLAILITFIFFFYAMRSAFLQTNCSLYLLGFNNYQRSTFLFAIFSLNSFLPFLTLLVVPAFANDINALIMEFLSLNNYFVFTSALWAGVAISIAMSLFLGIVFTLFSSHLPSHKVFNVLKEPKE